MGQEPGINSARQAFATKVADLLRANRRRIVLNWVGRVGALSAFRSRPNLDLAAVLSDVPPLFDDLIDLFAGGWVPGATLDFGPVREHAVAHATQRASLGFRVTDVVNEKLQLRNTIWEEIRANAGDLNPSIADIFALSTLVNDIVDTVIIETLETFEQITAAN